MNAEWEVFRRNYGNLYNLIHNADALAIQVYSSGLIAMSLRRDIEETTKTSEKNALLLNALEKVVLFNSRRFEDIMEVFYKEPYLQEIAESMRSETSYSIRCNLDKCAISLSSKTPS